MKGIRIFLAASALVWLPYGIYCFFQPAALGEFAGVTATSATGSTEVRAMYGGLQAAIGAFALLALLRDGLVKPVLLMLAFLCTGLALGRLGGILSDGGLSAYTICGLAFEIASAGLAMRLLPNSPVTSSP
jgi:hypothetical protein